MRFALLSSLPFLSLLLTTAASNLDSLEDLPRLFHNASDVRFYLWTRRNPVDHQELVTGDVQLLLDSNFDKSAPTKIIIHGFRGDPFDSLLLKIKDEYLIKGEHNCITVDWRVFQTINYLAVVSHVPTVGNYTADLIDFLISEGTPLSSFHLIGHSLGTHVVGFAGSAVESGTLPRITGLDPAWPLFTLNDTDARLDTSDAEFVDIIHTDSGTLLEGGLSFTPPIGHVDFYPNGGHRQPGCHDNDTADGDIDIDDVWGSCDHGRSCELFAESINSPVGFRSIQCESLEDFESGTCSGNDVALMGDPVPSLKTGTYYLLTNDESPYALGY